MELLDIRERTNGKRLVVGIELYPIDRDHLHTLSEITDQKAGCPSFPVRQEVQQPIAFWCPD